MNVLLANATAYPTIGGVENSLLYISKTLIRAGHNVKIFCFQYSPNEPLCSEHEGIEIIRYPCSLKRWPHAQFLNFVNAARNGIPKVLRGFRTDVIWSRSTPVGLGIRKSGYRGPLMHIFCTNAKMNCRGLFLQTQGMPLKRRLMLLGLWPISYLVFSRMERTFIRQCESVTFSENMRSQLKADYLKNINSCNVVYPGVDIDIFSPSNGERYFRKIFQKYGLHKNERLVLYVGRLSSAKNLKMLMDAVKKVKVNARLVIVGSGPEETRLKNYSNKIGISDRVVFAGVHQEMLPGFYAMSKVSILPTTIESFGQVYLESAASGTPVVGFGGDGRRVLTATNEIIIDGITGCVVRKVCSSALARKIDSVLLLDDIDYKNMSQRARSDVCRRFSWSDFVSEMISLSQRSIERYENSQ